jgi:hypothetical protein
MAGCEPEILAARDRKLQAARQRHQLKRQTARAALIPAEEKSPLTNPAALETVAPSCETEAGFAEEQPAEG